MAGDSACNSTFFVRLRRASRVVMVPLIWLGEFGQKLPPERVTSVFPAKLQLYLNVILRKCYLLVQILSFFDQANQYQLV